MTEQENVKVYELAKELGIDSISLLDKLKGLNISVKNHMSELASNDVETARSALGKKTSGAKASTSAKAPTVKKTAASASGSSTGTKVVRKKTASPADEAPAPAVAPTPPPAAAAAVGAPVIRRRVKADGATETSMPAQFERPRADEPTAEELEAAELGAQAAADTEAAAQESFDADEDSEMSAASGAEAPLGESPAESGSMTESSEAPAAGSATDAPKISRPAVILPPRPVAPRRSILKIVEPQAPPPKPMARAAPIVTPRSQMKPGLPTPGAVDKDGNRIVSFKKENLDQMAEEEAAKKRLGGGREAEIRPEDVRFADYRKKEMVFLPKRKRLPVGKQVRKTELTQMKVEKRIVNMGDTITVADLAAQLSIKAVDIVRKLMQMGTMASVNQSIDFDTATLVSAEYKYEVRNVAFKETSLIEKIEDTSEQLVSRPPIVTIMGHVDHGKTTLLDSIRDATVAAGEAGGITQHIGAYTIEKNGKLITFIDTPGHEAFTVMRARGANVTDIVILVVSADDGVMPQTREALSHAQAAKVPIIVAVNKIDKPGANPEKIKQGLAELNLLAEDWGGETMFIPVSALKKTNLDKLLDGILLQAEVLDLKANPLAAASGTVLEARLEKGRGPVVSVLISRGTLRVGDAVVAGQYSGKVRAMTDHKGKNVKEASPAFAVEILGFDGVPGAGERFQAAENEADARTIASHRLDQIRAKVAGEKGKVSLDDLFAKIKSGDTKELNVIVKGDVFGSVEAIRDSLVKLSTDKVKVKPIMAAPGGVTETDVQLAAASDAIILGFGVRPETKARQLAEALHVDIRTYTIIYELLDDVKGAMTGLLDKKKVEKFLGRAEVRQTFSVPKIGTVAGCSVIDGKILRGAQVRLLRDSRVIFDGKLSSLKRFKDDAKEVATGFECGMGIEGYNDLKIGDLIEAYQIDMVAPTLEEASASR